MTFVDTGSSSVPNSGLASLQNVVRVLATDPAAIPPYHASSLTTILSDAFGGNCRTAVLCCVSAAAEDYADTYKTLHFARELSYVRNHPVYNRQVFPITPQQQQRAVVGHCVVSPGRGGSGTVNSDVVARDGGGGNGAARPSCQVCDGATDDDKGDQMDTLFR